MLGGAQRHLFSKCDSTLWQSGCKEFYFNAANQLTFGSFATGDTSATKALEADSATHVVMVGNLQGTNTFSGLLDEVRIYSRALTLAEIQADRTTPITPPDETPPTPARPE